MMVSKPNSLQGELHAGCVTTVVSNVGCTCSRMHAICTMSNQDDSLCLNVCYIRMS